MILSQKINSVVEGIRKHLNERCVLISTGMLMVLSFTLAYWPQAINFSYAGENCTKQLTFFPGTLKASQDDTFEIKATETLNIANSPIIGKKVCLEPIGPPKEGNTQISLAPFGLSVLGKIYHIKTPATPAVSVQQLEKPLPVAKPVILQLSSTEPRALQT